MRVAQHHSPTYCWQVGSVSPRECEQISRTTMSTRIPQPLIFSIDDRLAEEHLTRLDLCSKNLKRINQLPMNIDFNVILLDQNEITKLEHLDIYPQLIQLSISHNRLSDIHLLHRLRSLQKLNLSYNLIDSIDSLKTLQNLVMLNISNNNLHSIAILNSCHALQSLDAGGNSIQQIEDLSHLTALKYLNLHRNFLDTLISSARSWPKSLHTLIISNNEIQDLTEISYLSTFINLNTLYMADNPCLSIVDERLGCHQPFDYRPYVLNWCLSIHNLDGIFITRKESLKAEWLLSQGKGRAFGLGEHAELVQYLTRVCGTDPDEKNDLHLSRIMLQQDLYHQQRHSTDEQMMATSDTMRDANGTLSRNTEGKFQQSTLISESEFLKVNTSSSTSTVDQPIASIYQQRMRTPSPGYSQATNTTSTYIDDQITENSSSNRYIHYDNRPIKPLDQNMLQTKLNQYPVDNRPNDNPQNFSSPTRRTPTNLTYNAYRYSPKTTTRGPTASAAFYTKSNRNFLRQRHNRTKRQTTNSSNTNALRALHHSHENSSHRLTTTGKVKNKEQQSSMGTSNENRNEHIDDDHDDDEIQLKSPSRDPMLFTRSTTMSNGIELQKLTASVETMRTSILQAYLDLHERFTKTTELQTSALTALWKQCETQSLTHQRETEKIIQDNQYLNQRIRDLETRLNPSPSKSVPPSSKQNPSLYPPLRAHISKRDTKSFFLHWIPNPLNEHRPILGYRIYIDDIFKGAIDSGRFEVIIDYIRDEGEYKIKLRTYDENGESADSNIVVARFRRQRSTTSNSEPVMIIHPNQSDDPNQNVIISPRERSKTPIMIDKQRNDLEQHNNPPITPEKLNKSDEHTSPLRISPHLTTNDNIISRKPPKSPTSSPSRPVKTSPNNGSCSKVLFTNPNNNSSSMVTRKRSPSPKRAGIMSRLAKNSQNNKRNHILSNALPIELTNSPTEVINSSQIQTKTAKRIITFQPDLNSKDHGHIVAQQVPIKSSDVLNSMNIHQLSTNSESLSSNSPPPPPIPPRISKNILQISLDQRS